MSTMLTEPAHVNSFLLRLTDLVGLKGNRGWRWAGGHRAGALNRS